MTKITIIGAGSYSWGPTFLRDIIITPALQGSHICLHDIDAGRMDLNFQLAHKLAQAAGADVQFTQTLRLEEALDGADGIILTITTGGLETMRPDLEIPARYGIRQAVGDTTGPGGLSRALRNVPVLAAMAEQVNAYCPEALFLNYTNPMSTLTRVLDRLRVTPKKTVGLCHEWIGVREKLAAYFGVQPDQVNATIAGVNHLPWAFDLNVNGRDAWEELNALAEKILDGEFDPDPGDDSPFADHGKVKSTLLQLFGAFPVAGDRHIAEFFGNFINADTNFGATYGIALTPVEFRAQEMAKERAQIESALRGELPIEPFLQARSGEAAGEILTALVTGGRYVGIMNLPNTGQVSNLAYGAVVETYGVIDALGAHALTVGGVPEEIKSILDRHIASQELTVESALTGDRELALQVLVNDPLMRGMEIESCRRMLNELLEANKAYLPLFFPEDIY